MYHTFDITLTVADTFKVDMECKVDPYTNEIEDWAAYDQKGTDISEDICSLFIQKRDGKFVRLDEHLIKEAAERMADQ